MAMKTKKAHQKGGPGVSTVLAKQRKQASGLSIPRCIFNRHSPDRYQAKWDGYNFVSTCVHCGTSIRRQAHNNWKRDWFEEA